MSKKRICWVTATYFLDVDLPVVPYLMNDFEIDWIIVSNSRQMESDSSYISSRSKIPFSIIEDNGYFFSPSHFKKMKRLVKEIAKRNYDLYYFDISDLLYLFPLIRKYIDIERVIIATHNVSVPKGARYAKVAKLSMKYILNHYKNFQVFSNNQREYLLAQQSKANVFLCPLMLKDYGEIGERKYEPVRRFLFFGNVVKYKRLDILLEAVNLLVEAGEENFKVNIHGYCREEVWDRVYKPLIKYPRFVSYDIRRVPNEEVGGLFENNDFFIMPYQDIAQSGAMTVALNYSMPIIASDMPAFREYIDDGVNSFILPSCDSRSLADVMKKTIRMGENEYSEIVKKLKITVEEKLSRDSIIKRYKCFLNSMV